MVLFIQYMTMHHQRRIKTTNTQSFATFSQRCEEVVNWHALLKRFLNLEAMLTITFVVNLCEVYLQRCLIRRSQKRQAHHKYWILINRLVTLCHMAILRS